jgi:hypothetical protein
MAGKKDGGTKIGRDVKFGKFTPAPQYKTL